MRRSSSQVFQPGKAEVFSLIALLVQRPSRAGHDLPLIWLSGQSSGVEILDTLDSQLNGSQRYKVPNVRVRADEKVNNDFRRLLSSVAEKLSVPEFRERLWFRRYSLVEWLMEQNLAEPGVDPPARLVELLRDRHQILRMVRDGDNLLNPRRCLGGSSGSAEQVGERVSLSYDSAMLVIDAVQNLAGRLRFEKWDPRSINPVSVHAEMFGQYSVAPTGSSQQGDVGSKKYTEKPFNGVSESIWFDLSGVPVHKRVSLLALQDISDPKQLPVEVFHCGIARADDDPSYRRPELNPR